MFKFLPILICLVLFSCTKEEEIFEEKATIDSPQARKGCRACIAPYSSDVIDIGNRTALFEWEYEGAPPSCGTYSVILNNLETGEQTIFTPVSNPMFLGDLLPCTSYSVGVSHNSNVCSSPPLFSSFTTACYCAAISNNPFFLNLTHLNGGGDLLEFTDPNAGYIDGFDQALTLSANQQHTIGISTCTNGSWSGPVYIKLWVDFDKNGVFASNELLSSSMRSINGIGVNNCTSVALDPFTLPNISTCDLSTRLILSPNVNAEPCDILAIGQVIDFTLHTSSNCN